MGKFESWEGRPHPARFSAFRPAFWFALAFDLVALVMLSKAIAGIA